VARGGEALNVDHRGAQCGGGERADAGDLQQPLDDRIVLVKPRQLALDVLAALVEGLDLCEQFDQARVQKDWDGTVLVRQCVANRRIARCAPTGMLTPNSRNEPRRKLMRAVRAAIHCERRR
jgi:hypothetical protein